MVLGVLCRDQRFDLASDNLAFPPTEHLGGARIESENLHVLVDGNNPVRRGLYDRGRFALSILHHSNLLDDQPQDDGADQIAGQKNRPERSYDSPSRFDRLPDKKCRDDRQCGATGEDRKTNHPEPARIKKLSKCQRGNEIEAEAHDTANRGRATDIVSGDCTDHGCNGSQYGAAKKAGNQHRRRARVEGGTHRPFDWKLHDDYGRKTV